MGLVSACTRLRKLVLDGCTNVRGTGVCAVADHCTHLKELHLANLIRLVNTDIQYVLLRCSRLEVLDVSRCKQLSAPFLRRELRHRCPKLRIKTLHELELPTFVL